MDCYTLYILLLILRWEMIIVQAFLGWLVSYVHRCITRTFVYYTCHFSTFYLASLCRAVPRKNSPGKIHFVLTWICCYLYLM